MGRKDLSRARPAGYSKGMRGMLAVALALTVSPAYAQVRAVPQLSVKAAPAISPAFSPSFAAPALPTPAIAAPALSAPSPLVSPVAALAQTGAALSAAASEGKDQGAVSRQAFDAGAKAPAEAPAVAAAPSSVGVPALEEANSPRHRITFRPMGPVRTAVAETVEVAALAIPVAFIAMILKAAISNPYILIPAMLALWGAGAYAMRGQLAGMRSTVVGGWQASHDQKYRVDPSTGRQKDIRGHKYGADRYEEWAPGPVGRLATSLIAAATAAAAAAFLLL